MRIDHARRIEDLPIPRDVRPTPLWSGHLLELSAHIGPYPALLMIDAIGGQSVYIPKDPEQNRLAAVIGADKAAIVSHVYGGERIDWPRDERALHQARRGPVIAAIREGRLTINAAVPILRLRRHTISRLVNRSDEGRAGSEANAFSPTTRPRAPGQLEMFD